MLGVCIDNKRIEDIASLPINYSKSTLLLTTTTCSTSSRIASTHARRWGDVSYLELVNIILQWIKNFFSISLHKAGVLPAEDKISLLSLLFGV